MVAWAETPVSARTDRESDAHGARQCFSLHVLLFRSHMLQQGRLKSSEGVKDEPHTGRR